MIEVTCNSCGKRYRVDDKYAGRVVPCSACGDQIPIVQPPPEEINDDPFELADPGENPEVHTAYDPSKAPPPAAASENSPGIDVDDEDDDEDIYYQDDDDVYIDQEQEGSSTSIPGAEALKGVAEDPPTVDATSPLGIVSLALGLVALGAAPFLKLLSLPISVTGFILGLIGLMLAIKQKRFGIRMPIGGLTSCVIAFAVPLVMLALSDSPAPEQTSTSDQQTSGNEANVDQGELVVPPEPAPGTQGPVSATQTVVRGNAEIKIISIEVAPVMLINLLTQRTEKSSDVVMAVRIQIKNLGTNSVLNYVSWAGQPKGYKRDFGEVVDQDDNGYQRRMYGEHTVPVGRVAKTSIAPKMSVNDVLLFKRPPATVQYLDLMLPGDNIGSDYMVNFRISKDAIKR